MSKALEFQSFILPILKNCFSNNLGGYIRDVMLYVEPWEDSIAICEVDSHIWHGTNDNWSPVEMADYLNRSLPSCLGFELLAGLSHYSCLFEAAPKVCFLLSGNCGVDGSQKTN